MSTIESTERLLKTEATVAGSGVFMAALSADISIWSSRAAEGFLVEGLSIAAMGGYCLWRTFQRLKLGDFEPDDPTRKDLPDNVEFVDFGIQSDPPPANIDLAA